MWIDVRNAGANVSGQELVTTTIQRAIDRCADSGGGVVYFPPGRYLSGMLRLRSGVQLYLESGAYLLASTAPTDYPSGLENSEGGHRPMAYYILAENESDISLAGMGTIDGQAPGDLRRGDPNLKVPEFRVSLIRFTDCRNVRIQDLTIRNCDSWTVHLRHCDGVWIDSLAILNNPHRKNSDGIDPDGCRNIHISNCHIVAGDDCIVLKSCKGQPTENVVVSNCTLETTATAIKLGTESHGDFRDIHVSNCVIRNSSGGIGFFLKDGATMERISFSHISIEDRDDDPIVHLSCPLYMDIERRHADSNIGRIRDISFSDIQICGRTGPLIQGMSESPIENLTLRDILIRIDQFLDFGARAKRVGGKRTTSDERDSLYAQQPSYATIAHVQGLTVENLRVVVAPEVYARQQGRALSLHRVSDAAINNVFRRPLENNSSQPLIHAEHCERLSITDQASGSPAEALERRRPQKDTI